MSLQKNLRLLTWFHFFTDFKLYAPIAIIYFAWKSNSYALGASIFSVTYLVSALCDVPTGIFADRAGRKKTLVMGAFFSVAAVLFYAIGLNYWFLFVGAVFEGLSRAFYSGNNAAFLHNLLSEAGKEHDYHVYSGKLNAMFQWALALSGICGALLASRSFSLVLWLSLIPQLGCLLLALQIIERKKQPLNQSKVLADLVMGAKAFIHNPQLRLLSLHSMLDYGFGESAYQFQAAFYQTVIPIWAVGLVKTLSNLGAAIGFYFSGKVITKFKAIPVLLVGEAYSKMITFLALIFPTPVSPFLLATTSVCYGFNAVATDSLLQKEFTDQQRATQSSLNSFGGSIFFAMMVLLMGVMADKFGAKNALLIAQFVALITLGLLWRLYRRQKV